MASVLGACVSGAAILVAAAVAVARACAVAGDAHAVAAGEA